MKNTCQQIDCPVERGQIVTDDKGQQWLVDVIVPAVKWIRLVKVGSTWRSVIMNYDEVAAWANGI